MPISGLVLTTYHLHGILFSSTLLPWALGPENWVQTLALTSCVTLGKSFGLPKLPFLLLTNGGNNTYFYIE